jgi:hypothetical protein
MVVEVKVTELPWQIGFAEAVMVIVTGDKGVTMTLNCAGADAMHPLASV